MGTRVEFQRAPDSFVEQTRIVSLLLGRRNLEHGERRRRSAPVAVLVFALAATALTGGCAATGDRSEAAPDSAAASADSPTAGATTRSVGVDVKGVEGVMARNVHARLTLAKEDCDAPRWRVERLLERAAKEAREALRALGYYEPKSVELNLGERDGCWQATVAVSPGEPVLITAVEMRLEGAGSGDEAFGAHLDTLGPAIGDVLNHGAYEEAKRSIERYAADHGYLEGGFVTRQFRVDAAARSAEVELVYRPGLRFRFGPLGIEQSSLDRLLVERLAAYREGEPYDARHTLEVSRRLSQSGYFERVDVHPRVDAPVNDTIPVEVSLTPRKRYALTAGAGATTDAGPRLRLGFEDRRASSGGHRWSMRSEASLVTQLLDAEYRIPLGDPRSEWLDLQAGAMREHTDSSRSDAARLGVKHTTLRRGDWLETRFVTLTHDDFAVGRTRGIARLLTPGVSFATTRYDDRQRPTDGYRLHLEVRGSHEVVGSDASFLRVSGAAGWVRGMPWGGRLLARAEVGAMAVDRFDALPPSQRFFTGGDTTVRGYGFNSLGPVDESGEVVGGRALAAGGIEYEHPVKEGWSGAVFADVGNAFDTEYRNEGVAIGVGFGVRWQSPIGAVRLDLAHPLDDTRRFRVHLRLGPDL